MVIKKLSHFLDIQTGEAYRVGVMASLLFFLIEQSQQGQVFTFDNHGSNHSYWLSSGSPIFRCDSGSGSRRQVAGSGMDTLQIGAICLESKARPFFLFT